jgi:hypothetical protein
MSPKNSGLSAPLAALAEHQSSRGWRHTPDNPEGGEAPSEPGFWRFPALQCDPHKLIRSIGQELFCRHVAYRHVRRHDPLSGSQRLQASDPIALSWIGRAGCAGGKRR